MVRRVIASFAVLLLSSAVSHAAPDAEFTIDIGPGGQRVESGGTGVVVTGPPNIGDNGPEITNFAINPATGFNLTISIDDTNASGSDQGSIDWRDRGDGSNDPLIALGEDFIKNNSGIIRVTISGLLEGQYDVTSYHVDPDFTQSDEIEVLVDIGDGNGFINTGATGDASQNVGGVGGLTTAEMMASAAVFSFTADGINDVTLLFDGTPSGDDETPLNGLFFQFFAPVPEPGSLLVWAIAVAVAAVFGWRNCHRPG